MDVLRNFAYTGVLVPPTPPNLGTTLTVYNGTGARFPAAPFSISIWPLGLPADPTNAEILRVTAKAGDVWTVQRAQEGTTGRAILINDQVAQAMTKKTIDDLVADLKAYTDAKVAAIPIPTYIPPRVHDHVSASGIAVNCDAWDATTINGLAEATTITNPLGTPEELQPYTFRIRDNGTSRALFWGTAYMSACAFPLPASTITYRTLHIGFRWNAYYARWQMVALTQE